MALSANTPIPVELGDLNDLPAAASVIYEGSMVGLNASGYARALTAGDLFLGHAFAKVDNSGGSAGDLAVTCRQGRYKMQVTLTSVAVTDVGKPVFASDDATVTLTRGANSRVGTVARYVTTNTAVVAFEPNLVVAPLSPELDCETGQDTADHVLVPAWMNPRGLLVTGVYGRITEQMAGSSQDQGVVTVYDESNNAVATLTPSDAAADAVGDVVVGYALEAATTGDATKTVAAGEFVDCKVTQATAGGTPAGKMVVYLTAQPLI